jgi:predicted DNA-binding protein
MAKSSNYRIRIEPELHQEFLDICKSEDRPAAQVMREFMRAYVNKHRQGLQADLFVAEQPQTYTDGAD